MRILIRDEGSSNWKEVETAEYREETELQHLLASSPQLILVNEIREGASPLVVAVREFGLPGSGNTDIVLFSANGDIAVVECKLADNSEIKRKVIGQILEYGAYLWNMTYEQVDDRVQKLRGESLINLVAKGVDALGISDWDEETFRDAVKETLKNGSFILMIAVDQTNEELSRTIRFLNGCGNPAFSFCALEMRRFRANKTEILVPYLHGASRTRTELPGKRKRWTEREFLQAIHEGLPPEVTEAITNLLNWSKETARVSFGTGAKTGSFTFYYLKNGKTFSVFTVSTEGKLWLNYGWLATRVEPTILEEFHQSIHNIPSFRDVKADFSKWPSIWITDALVGQAGALEEFKETVKKLGEKLRS